MTAHKTRRGAALGAAIGITDMTLYDMMVAQYEAAGYEVETGGASDYLYMEITNPKERMKEEGDKNVTVIHYFNSEGTQMKELKVLLQEVTEVIVQTDGKYVM